jgi:hypothetical protein
MPSTNTASLEAALAQVVTAMRSLAARHDPTDFLSSWMAALSERRPLLLAVALFDGEALAWAMTPSDEFAVLVEADDDRARADLANETRSVAEAREAIAWLVREHSGAFPAEGA